MNFCKRGIQTLVHPQKYVRLLKLTDGSTIRVTTLTPPPPTQQSSSQCSPFTVSLLNLDSANHPSWNPKLRDRLLLDDRGQVSKFRAKFELTNNNNNNDNKSDNSDFIDVGDFSDFLEMDPNLNVAETQFTKIKVKTPLRGRNTATKKKK